MEAAEQIKKLCKYVEELYNVEILFCVENGSRAWNMHSRDSDYDVRFVFKRPLDSYLGLKTPPDVITETFDEDGKPSKPEGCFFDLVGFDIFKFAKMLSSSNPTCVEWVTSNIIYYKEINKVFKEFVLNQYNPIALYHHYRSMCKQNYEKYLKSGAYITYKKYLYAMRGLVNAKYISATGFIPPLDFADTLNQCEALTSQGVEVISPTIINTLRDIIKKKRDQDESQITENVVHIDNYIESFLKNVDGEPQPRKSFALELDREVTRLVKSDLVATIDRYTYHRKGIGEAIKANIGLI